MSTTSTEHEVPRSIERIAISSAILGALGLIALLSQGAWAADKRVPPAPGFGGGARGFQNPFAAGGNNPGQPVPTMGEDDEDEDFDVPPEGFPPAPQRGGISGSNSMAAPSDPNFSMGGSAQGGVVSHTNPALAKIDSETGEGSKELVTDFNYPDADIMDIAKTLGRLTGKSFILDKDVKGRISIISNAPITVGDAWKAFLTALDINGFALIPSGKFIRIARQRDARDKQLKTYTGSYSPDTDALITRVFPLKYLSAEEVARNFRSFMPANSRIIPYEQTNTVIVTDTGSNIAKLSKLLDILDVEGYDAGIEVIPVKYASAVELSKLIDTLVPGTAATGAPGAGNRFAAGGRFTARRTKEGGIINTIIADERTNTLIVHANTKGADQVRELVTKLDQKLPSTAGGGKVHVIYLQFADAEKLGTTLNNISAQAGGGIRSGSPAGGTGANPIQGSLFEGQIKVAPDVSTNSLVVTASPADFVTVQRVVNKLDIPRDQVYAEVVIMEINMGRDFAFSTNVINPTNGIGLTPNTDLIDFVLSPFAGKGATLGFKAGQEKTLSVGGKDIKVSGVQGLIRAIQTNSNANILATPQILALDNTEATFETAEKIPFATTTAVQGAVSTGVQKESVSLSIKIKPQINKVANFVKLDIETKLADIEQRDLPAQVKDLALATLERNAKTSIVVADEDTAVLGGLMRDTQSDQVSKIPLLGDIPLLGWLFKSKASKVMKTNLLIFITPHIVRQYETVRAILDKKLRDRDNFIERSAGGVDPIRDYRDDMIRSLPDIKTITSAKPVRSNLLDDDDVPASPAKNIPGGATAPSNPMPPANQVPQDHSGLTSPAPLDPSMMPMAPPPPPASAGIEAIPSMPGDAGQ